MTIWRPAQRMLTGFDTAPTGTATQMRSGADVPCHTVLLKANSANTAPIFVGADDSMTAALTGGNETTCGYPLAGGEAISLSLDNLDKIYILSTSADQEISYMVLSYV